jgi:hypothetical protein
MQQPALMNLAAAALIAQLGFLVILVGGMSILNPQRAGHQLVWVTSLFSSHWASSSCPLR